ncbi:DUF1801 domain-containing protein [Pedobacter insulae]|uniref:YdhG-like domain-containing protein n=1 Tax=Pedobacter insulae TaxID=414048 RepID=A0A1I2UDP4_9SPHI|nr:DUF1801 domain-containing protein [Pedobacter insulae]SFG75272.1 protein of unknown function (DU1801) [Pedobacter insulae]
MAKSKTAETTQDVVEFINSFADTTQKREDSLALLTLMQNVSGDEPKMWGPSIIGFGSYHYKYESGHEGDAPLVGFSPRKAAISLYIYTGLADQEALLKDLGKFKMAKACLYVKKLSDVNEAVLTKMIQAGISYLKSKYPK